MKFVALLLLAIVAVSWIGGARGDNNDECIKAAREKRKALDSPQSYGWDLIEKKPDENCENKCQERQDVYLGTNGVYVTYDETHCCCGQP
jgi:hypothetical protein